MNEFLDSDDTHFEMTEDTLGSVELLVGEVDRCLQRQKWSNEAIRERFGRRSIEQLLKDGHTCYMNPCADFTFLALWMMQKAKVNAILVIRELTWDAYTFNRLHTAIEFQDAIGNSCFLDFVTMNKVLLGSGPFTDFRKGIQTIQVYQLGNHVEPSTSPFNMISTIAFENLDFEKQIEQLTKDNTDKQYEGYLQRLGDNTNLYLEDVRKT